MRFLCLHGIGTSAAIFEAQIAALRYRLGDAHEYEFIEGSLESPPAKGIEEVFGKQEAYYAYFDASVTNILKAVNDLAEFLDTEGPFDGIIGFSQGGSLATTLMAGVERGLIEARIKCLILLSCGMPWDLAALKAGESRRLTPEQDGGCITIPTAHFWGQNDLEGFAGNHDVALLCDESSRVEVVHNAGHGVPSGKHLQELDAMVAAVNLTFERAEIKN
ncbi:MAG: hypothetical protein M1820_009178 [Bogoriella megaspora]|nr:MAG: hypothetical protein M1820_009178 [Bogoriella megaspora]